MIIKLKNIGIIGDSSIEINGLTVITGKNNSGKSTVGRTLYALFDAVCNFRRKYQIDRYSYIHKQLDNVENVMESFSLFRFSRVKVDSICGNFTALRSLVTGDYKREISNEAIEQFAHDIEKELKVFDMSILESDSEFLKSYSFIAYKEKSTQKAFEMFDSQRNRAIEILNKLFDDIDKDPDLTNFIRESISQSLSIEFANQIQPVKYNVEKSSIEIMEENAVLYNLDIVDNKVLDTGKPVFIGSPWTKVYLIDNPSIFDETPMRWHRNREDVIESDTILNTNRILSHNEKLKRKLKNRNRPTVLEQTVLDDSLKEIQKQIEDIIPGTFEFSPEGEFYVEEGRKLSITNMATGSKMFSIIKILLETGEIDNSTVLILDEPEAHLHPMWQNSFAEIIVLLVKKLGTNVLLTTHSPNFMLAIDAFMRKHNLSEKTNFYQTNTTDTGFVEYQCVNDEMEIIYQDFLRYLSEMKILRNKYLDNSGV